MKKIKDKLTDIFNRYIIFGINSIIKKIKKLKIFFQLKNAIISFVTLNFFFNNQAKLSIFSRYLILTIILLFSYLFYLSIPTLYNYGEIQKNLNKKLLNEFNLNTSLSANITYKILPSPNFEVTNVILTTDTKDSFDEFVQIKKMKIYIYVKSLYNKDNLEIKDVVISEANFNINSKSYNYINNYFKNKISSKKIKIRKSKIFFRENNSIEDVITLATIKKLNFFYDNKKNINKINFDGMIYNTNYDLVLQRNIDKKKNTNIQVKFKNLNTFLKSTFFEEQNNKGNYNGKISLKFPGSEINTKYKIVDRLVSLKSEKSNIRNNNLTYNGKINISPFYYNLSINIESLDIIKFFNNISKLKNLLDEKIFLNKKVNGTILFNIDSLKGIKFFNEAKIKINIVNGKLLLNNSLFISDKIGEILFKDSYVEIIEGKKIFKSKIFFELYNQKKFYQKLQIPKSSRIKLENIYFEIEKDLDASEIIINKFIVNRETSNTSLANPIDLSNKININEVNDLKNWIELKKFSKNIFFEISKSN